MSDNNNYITKNEIMFFKDEVLSEIKSFKSITNSKFTQINEMISNRILMFNNRIEDFSSKLNELLDSITTSKLDHQKIEELYKDNEKIKTQLDENSIRVIEAKDIIESSLYKYDRVIMDNLEIPGFIGNNSKYSNIKQFLIFVRDELGNNKSFKNKQITENNSNKDKIEKFNKKLTVLNKNIIDTCDKLFMNRLESLKKDLEMKFANRNVDINKEEQRNIDNSLIEIEIKKNEELCNQIKEQMKNEIDIINNELKKYKDLTNANFVITNKQKDEFNLIKKQLNQIIEDFKYVKLQKNLDFQNLSSSKKLFFNEFQNSKENKENKLKNSQKMFSPLKITSSIIDKNKNNNSIKKEKKSENIKDKKNNKIIIKNSINENNDKNDKDINDNNDNNKINNNVNNNDDNNDDNNDNKNNKENKNNDNDNKNNINNKDKNLNLEIKLISNNQQKQEEIKTNNNLNTENNGNTENIDNKEQTTFTNKEKSKINQSKSGPKKEISKDFENKEKKILARKINKKSIKNNSKNTKYKEDHLVKDNIPKNISQLPNNSSTSSSISEENKEIKNIVIKAKNNRYEKINPELNNKPINRTLLQDKDINKKNINNENSLIKSKPIENSIKSNLRFSAEKSILSKKERINLYKIIQNDNNTLNKKVIKISKENSSVKNNENIEDKNNQRNVYLTDKDILENLSNKFEYKNNIINGAIFIENFRGKLTMNNKKKNKTLTPVIGYDTEVGIVENNDNKKNMNDKNDLPPNEKRSNYKTINKNQFNKTDNNFYNKRNVYNLKNPKLKILNNFFTNDSLNNNEQEDENNDINTNINKIIYSINKINFDTKLIINRLNLIEINYKPLNTKINEIATIIYELYNYFKKKNLNKKLNNDMLAKIHYKDIKIKEPKGIVSIRKVNNYAYSALKDSYLEEKGLYSSRDTKDELEKILKKIEPFLIKQFKDGV